MSSVLVSTTVNGDPVQFAEQEIQAAGIPARLPARQIGAREVMENAEQSRAGFAGPDFGMVRVRRDQAADALAPDAGEPADVRCHLRRRPGLEGPAGAEKHRSRKVDGEQRGESSQPDIDTIDDN